MSFTAWATFSDTSISLNYNTSVLIKLLRVTHKTTLLKKLDEQLSSDHVIIYTSA